ncbi:potassium voltage-gated channel subfamily H member 2-like [Montipora capricornis]|uniref:potassium voltage-gated channel subfamily H member 2-like n=1 Tax=Montipora capricornis TaxID=246305 RepID=UPI0035F14657
MPVKRGLVAPQNIFIQTIIKKFDGSPDRNFVLGNAQVADLPIIYCNDGFCELTGYSRAELVQKHCSCDFLCGENTDIFAARQVKSALQGHQEKHVEILYYRKDGSAFLCSVLIAPVKNEEGSAVMYIVNHEDVTWSPNRDDVALQGMTTFVLFNDIALIPGLVILTLCVTAQRF